MLISANRASPVSHMLGDQTWSKFFQSAVSAISPRRPLSLLRLMIDRLRSDPLRLPSRQDLIYLLRLTRYQHPLLSPVNIARHYRRPISSADFKPLGSGVPFEVAPEICAFCIASSPKDLSFINPLRLPMRQHHLSLLILTMDNHSLLSPVRLPVSPSAHLVLMDAFYSS